MTQCMPKLRLLNIKENWKGKAKISVGIHNFLIHVFSLLLVNELEHQYEIPACPLTKLLANPTLFSNHFDYYTTLPPPIAVTATATTGLHQARLTRPEVLVKPEKTMSASIEYASTPKEGASPADSEGFGFLSKLAFWSWGKNEVGLTANSICSYDIAFLFSKSGLRRCISTLILIFRISGYLFACPNWSWSWDCRV